MSLAARCPACRTAFRVVPDQLRISDGWVRCGRCNEVFDASETLFDLRAIAAPVPPPAQAASEPTPASAFEPEAPAAGTEEMIGVTAAEAAAAPVVEPTIEPTIEPSLEPAVEPAVESSLEPAVEPAIEPVSEPADGPVIGPSLEPAVESAVAPHAPAADERTAPDAAVAPDASSLEADQAAVPETPEASADHAAEPEAVAADTQAVTAPDGPKAEQSGGAANAVPNDDAASTAAPPANESLAEATATPGFVREVDRAQRWQSPEMRALLAGAAVLLAGAALIQGLRGFHAPITAEWPQARAWVEPLCRLAGCRLEPRRLLDTLSVEGSSLVQIDGSAATRLSLVLRNRDRGEVLLPAIELTLTDVQGTVVARKVLDARELGAPATTIAGGAEIALQGLLDTGDLPVVGYTIELFYP